tara:strand:+ start:103 stop:1536 length:1434 start_codon:yes stop_codon:yes gene_type:complete
MSKIEVNQIDVQCGSTLTVGSSGKTVSLAPGASQTGFGRTGTVDWCTTAKTSPFTAVSGDGFFINTTCGAITVTLPSSPSQGDIVAFKDYGGTFDCSAKALTVCRNGSKINGACSNTTLRTQGQSITLIYVDGVKGWQDVQDSTSDTTGQSYIAATGGSVSNSPCGDFKLHKFTGDSTFVVSDAGNAAGSNTVEYLVVAGGGGGGADGGGGGGAGGVRSNFPSPTTGGIPVTAPTTFPVTVGAGGAGATEPGSGTVGCNSVFAGTTPITSAGGGGGSGIGSNAGGNGGSGGGGRRGPCGSGGSGNTPPVVPSQGEPGGQASAPGDPSSHNKTSGGGGGADNAGQAGPATSPSPSAHQFADGGDGRSFPVASFGANGETQPTGQFFGGGGGSGQGGSSGSGNTPYCTPLGNGGKGGGGPGGDSPGPGSPSAQVFGRTGTAATGGGGGGAAEQCASGPPARNGGAGGGGVVIIRYRFQN